MNLISLLNRLGRYFPKNLSETWDYPGYQTGNKELGKEVKKVLLCLDYTEFVHPYAKKEQPDLILTHHPFFFGKRKEVLKEDSLKAILEERILKDLNAPLYSFHTDFDKAKGGMNDTLLDFLGWENLGVCPDGCMRKAKLPKEMTITEIGTYLCEKFNFPYVLSTLDTGKKISTACFLAGGGASDYPLAIEEKADGYISGDCSHHTRLELRRYDLPYLELPHECEEIGFLLGMKKALEKIDPNLTILTYAYERPFEVIEYAPDKK